MKYYLIVGEASGDLHASRLMRSLKKVDELAEFRFFAGAQLTDCTIEQAVNTIKLTLDKMLEDGEI